jgi:hypothetical protein
MQDAVVRKHFSTTKTLRRFKSGLASLALASASLSLAQTAAPEPFKFQIPSNYINRFSNTEGVLDFGPTVSDVDAVGVRAFPLPTPQDFRVSLVRHTNYWEYVLSTRVKDTTLLGGVINSGIVQGELGNISFSRFSVGYAFTVWENRIRILNNVGVGYDWNSYFQGTPENPVLKVRGGYESNVLTPYTFSQVSGGYGEPIGKEFNWRLDANARLYTFPLDLKAQLSLDVTPSFTYRPVAGLALTASHLERFVLGDSSLYTYNLDRYQESNASVTYRIPGTPDFGLGALRVRGSRNWTGDYTYLRNDVFLNIKALPFLIGPSVGYQWGPAKNGSNSQWLYALVVIGR